MTKISAHIGNQTLVTQPVAQPVIFLLKWQSQHFSKSMQAHPLSTL
jgi:hypothetical protein